MDKDKKGGGLRGFLKRNVKLRDGGLLGYVNKRQKALDEAAAPVSKKTSKKKKKESAGTGG